ncbi:hypothetical protein AO398_23895 [Methylobacterium sp. GXS13]|nr:hypothetical protein AO398_23895 [Methylobacterium sp. GXS13]
MLRRAGTKRPSTADDALAVIDRAGDAGIAAPEIMVQLRRDAPCGAPEVAGVYGASPPAARARPRSRRGGGGTRGGYDLDDDIPF